MATEPNVWTKVWTVPCPVIMPGCGAPKGDACRSSAGGHLPPGQTHRVRVRAFLKTVNMAQMVKEAP